MPGQFSEEPCARSKTSRASVANHVRWTSAVADGHVQNMLRMPRCARSEGHIILAVTATECSLSNAKSTNPSRMLADPPPPRSHALVAFSRRHRISARTGRGRRTPPNGFSARPVMDFNRARHQAPQPLTAFQWCCRRAMIVDELLLVDRDPGVDTQQIGACGAADKERASVDGVGFTFSNS